MSTLGLFPDTNEVAMLSWHLRIR